MLETIRVIGFRIPSVEAVIAEVEIVMRQGEPSVPETVRKALLMACLDQEGQFDEGYQYVCAVDEKGRVVSRVDRVTENEDGEPYPPDFELAQSVTGDVYSVLFVRLRNDELLYGAVRADRATLAGELAIQYGVQLFGPRSDLQFVAVLSPDGTVVHVSENWGF